MRFKREMRSEFCAALTVVRELRAAYSLQTPYPLGNEPTVYLGPRRIINTPLFIQYRVVQKPSFSPSRLGQGKDFRGWLHA